MADIFVGVRVFAERFHNYLSYFVLISLFSKSVRVFYGVFECTSFWRVFFKPVYELYRTSFIYMVGNETSIPLGTHSVNAPQHPVNVKEGEKNVWKGNQNIRPMSKNAQKCLRMQLKYPSHIWELHENTEECSQPLGRHKKHPTNVWECPIISKYARKYLGMPDYIQECLKISRNGWKTSRQCPKTLAIDFKMKKFLR